MPTVAAIRRYPVKAMGGESVDIAQVDERGLVGDRWFAVVDEDGRFATGKDSRRFRRHDEIFDYTALTTVTGGVVVRSGEHAWPVGDPALDAHLGDRMGAAVRVLPESDVPHFDAQAVSVVGTATLDWLAERTGAPADARRLRPNLVVATDEPFVEETWVGGELTIGGVRLRVTERVERCRMVDVDQVGVRPEARWLTLLGAEREVCAAVYAQVVTPGLLRVGATVQA
ncbi:MAG: MOSC domain-containing protein [Nocardioidaceae bacterium]